MKNIRYIVIMIIMMMAVIKPVHGESNIIHQIDINCVIDEKGTATINETWDMTTVSGMEGYKDLYHMVDQPVSLIGVREGDQAFDIIEKWDIKAQDKAGKCGLIKDGDDYELCFGLSGHGRHQYTMTYTIAHFVNQYQETQGINFVFLSDMALTIEAATIDLSSESEAFTDETCDIWGFGYQGTCTFRDGHVIMQTSKRFKEEKMQLLMRLGGYQYSDPSTFHRGETMASVIKDAKKGSRFGNLLDIIMQKVMIALAVITAILLPCILIYMRVTDRIKRKYERRLYFEDGTYFKPENVHMFRDVPQNTNLLRSFEMLRKTGLLNYAQRANILNAYMLKWIVEGYVRITPKEKGNKTIYEIDLTKSLPEDTSRIEASAHAIVCSAAGENKILEHEEFNTYYHNHPKELQSWYEKVVYRLGDDTLGHKYIYKKNAVSDTFLKVDYRQTTLTDKGRQLLEQLYGLKRFLINQDNMKEKQAIEVHLWNHYLQYAALFGIADVVRKQMNIVCPDYHVSSETLADYVEVTKVIHETVQSSASSESYSSSGGGSASSGSGGSSSHSGGGSGYSGGGGGGVR